MVKSFVNGILGNLFMVSDATNQVASIAEAKMGHSHPTEGPMKDDYKWMPDMMDLFAKGIIQNTPKVENAVTNLAQGMSDSMNPDYSGQLGQINSSIQGMNLSTGDTVVYVQISDGQLQRALANITRGNALRSGGR
jgi:hypothetical protein